MRFLSGFVFPIENMPKPQALGLLVSGVAVLTISVARFRERLD